MYVYEILKSFVMCEFIGTRLSWMSKICMYEDFPRERKTILYRERRYGIASPFGCLLLLYVSTSLNLFYVY